MSHCAVSASNVFESSAFCWVEELPPNRNQFVSFERSFTLDRPTQAVLHLFADTRYRLWVNGHFIAYGPGRFVTAHPVYDSHDLASHLRAGANLLRVEVNYYGASSFQSMPDGRPGFIAAGGLDNCPGACFNTPGEWSARVHKAWDADSPFFSFAQNPVEICDTRVLAAELAEPAKATVAHLSADAIPWHVPVPRSTPYPDYASVRPARLSVAAPAVDALRWGMQLDWPFPVEAGAPKPKLFVSYSTWIHSHREQTVPLECFWTDVELNGEPLKIEYPQRLGNHGQTQARLKAGWNFLAGNVEILTEHWAFLLGLPRSSDASLHARPSLDCAETFAVSPCLGERMTPTCPASPAVHAIPSDWILRSGSVSRVTPARLAAWDAPDEAKAVRGIPYGRLSEAAAIVARSALWSFDFGDEYYGQPELEVEAPAGSVLDVAYDDWKRADGCVNLYGSNPFTDAADRFVLQGGRQRIEVLNPRGGIHIQLILRAPVGSPPVPLTVHDVQIRRRTTINTRLGVFSCGDAILDWAWDTSVHTLQASTDEAYADCPWRERGSYIGDSLVNLHLHRLISNDFSVGRATLERFGQAQLPDGQLACCAPAWLVRPHEDFTLLWIVAVRDYWAFTGDLGFVDGQWPVIRRIWDSPTWRKDSDGLWDTTGMRVFLDWGVLPSERGGKGNTAVNILRVAAAKASAELAAALGRNDEATHFTSEAEAAAAALQKCLWIEVEGRFAASVGADTPAVHANILALRYDVGPADKIMAYLEPKLHGNFRAGLDGGQHNGHAELYFFHYLLPALARHGRFELAESMIREHYGFLKSLGFSTLPECFQRAQKGVGSSCHSWSGAPAIYATDWILGLRMAKPGDTDQWLLAPSHLHERAEGVVPHPRGVIRIRWERRGSRVAAKVSAPEGVTVVPSTDVDLS